jgi:hypothetical protein
MLPSMLQLLFTPRPQPAGCERRYRQTGDCGIAQKSRSSSGPFGPMPGSRHRRKPPGSRPKNCQFSGPDRFGVAEGTRVELESYR